MRDQAPLRPDHVGVPVLADLDLGDDVPDQLQIDLGDADAGILARAGQRQRHVGLGVPAEIDRPVIDLVRNRLGELWIPRQVDPTVDRVHRQPRDPQPLLAARVHLGELGDPWHLTQQPQRVEPALLDRARRPRQLRGPAELALDLLDELADLGGRRLSLLMLDPDQRGLVLTIIEEDFEQPVGEQRNGDDGHEQRDVFGEQPGPDPPPHRLAGHGPIRGRARQRPGLRSVGRERLIRRNLARRRDVVSRERGKGPARRPRWPPHQRRRVQQKRAAAD